MANPTTNYGFVLPTPTDLVTDLPADFDVALQGVDTRLKALQPGTTLGDIAYSSATANTNTRLGIGTTGQVLTVASGVPAWSTVSAGGMTLLSTTTLSGTSTNISVTTGYKDLLIIASGVSANAGGSEMVVRPNNTSSTCAYTGSGYVANASAFISSTTEYQINAFGGSVDTETENAYVVQIFNYDQGTYVKAMRASGYYKQVYQGNTRRNTFNNAGGFYSTAAITSVAFTLVGGNTFSSGQVLVYGVK
jgi:hypothetical protein